MELEHAIEVFPIDTGLQAKVDALIAKGWQLVPGVLPVAVYHVVRIKPEEVAADPEQPEQPSGRALGKLKIDDSKIMIVPGKKN